MDAEVRKLYLGADSESLDLALGRADVLSLDLSIHLNASSHNLNLSDLGLEFVNGLCLGGRLLNELGLLSLENSALGLKGNILIKESSFAGATNGN